MSRYSKTQKFANSSEYYEYLRKKRNLKKVVHYETPILYNPTIADRVYMATDTHVWKYGDRYYKLSAKYYGSPIYWWVIAWYNGRPTEADLRTGDLLEVPVNLESALRTLGV